jgi:hypothetical protein
MVLVVVFFSDRLVKLEVGFFHLSDGLRGSNQVIRQFFLDYFTRSVHETDIFKLLIIVCAAFFLFGVN